jgi:chorismate synthase
MLRILTAGESHGPCLTAILEGMPAGLPLAEEEVNLQLRRRQAGYGSGGRMQIEQDRVRLIGGVLAGQTTGAPIALQIENRDWANWRGREISPMTVPRPGHADLAAAIKYGYRDLRLSLERASARETAARVAVGAVCRRFLAEFGVVIGSYVVQIGSAAAILPEEPSYPERFVLAEESDVRCPDALAAEAMRAGIDQARAEKDTLGGVFEVVALGLPPGLGSHVHWDRRLDGRLLAALGSIPGVKGAEIGRAFENAARRGSQVHDEILVEGRGGVTPPQLVRPTNQAGGLEGGVTPPQLVRPTNRAGGLEGGITTGEPLVLRAAMKPISTLAAPLRSVDLARGEPAAAPYERSDACAVPRAAVVGEAMAAFVLADALLEKLGGDSLPEMRPRFAALKRGTLDDLEMDDAPWLMADGG